MGIALIGAATDIVATVNDYNDSEFKKPIDLRVATVVSYNSHIDSAAKRGDKDEALRVRLEYEENWRNNRKLVSLTMCGNQFSQLRIKT